MPKEIHAGEALISLDLKSVQVKCCLVQRRRKNARFFCEQVLFRTRTFILRLPSPQKCHLFKADMRFILNFHCRIFRAKLLHHKFKLGG